MDHGQDVRSRTRRTIVCSYEAFDIKHVKHFQRCTEKDKDPDTTCPANQRIELLSQVAEGLDAVNFLQARRRRWEDNNELNFLAETSGVWHVDLRPDFTLFGLSLLRKHVPLPTLFTLQTLLAVRAKAPMLPSGHLGSSAR